MEAYEAQDYKTAHQQLLPLAKKGNPDAQFLIAEMCARELGVPWDIDEAIRWYHAAAEQGQREAQRRLGGHYFAGRGVPADADASNRWFETAADQGDGLAAARLCENNVRRGRAEPIVRPIAVERCRQAANGGDALSQKYWADLLAEGEWVDRDLVRAYAWYTVSPRGQHYRFDVAVLTPEERIDSEALVSESKEKFGRP